MLEADWQRRVTDTATLHGWRHVHTRRAVVRKGRVATPTSLAGWPDLVLWHERLGEIWFVELKSDRGVLSSDQTEVLLSLANAGGTVATWRPRDWPRVLGILQGGGVARGSAGDGPHQQGNTEGAS